MSYSSTDAQLPTRKSLYELQTRQDRLAVDCEYQSAVRNRDRFTSDSTAASMDTQTYIKHLEQANKNLHLQLDQLKHQS